MFENLIMMKSVPHQPQTSPHTMTIISACDHAHNSANYTYFYSAVKNHFLMLKLAK